MPSKALALALCAAAALSRSATALAEECATALAEEVAGAAEEETALALLQLKTNCPAGWSSVAGTKKQCEAEENAAILQWYNGHCCVEDSYQCVVGKKNDCVAEPGNAQVAYTGSSQCCVPSIPGSGQQECVSGKKGDCRSAQCPVLVAGEESCFVNAFWTGDKCCMYQFGETSSVPRQTYYTVPTDCENCNKLSNCPTGHFFTGSKCCQLGVP